VCPHEAVRLAPPFVAADDPPEVLQELSPVFRLAEQKLVPVRKSRNVMQRIGQIRARFAGHAFKLRLQCARLRRGIVTS